MSDVMADQVISEKSENDTRDSCDDDTQENLDDLRKSCEFSKKTWREDMALVVENRKLFVAGNILALVSPVFLAKIEETLIEGVPRELVLDDKSYDDIVEFLRCVYPNILKPISLQNVFKMLPLAAEYKVLALTERCEKFLIGVTNENTSAEVLCKSLIEAWTFELEDLTNQCIQLASVLSISSLRYAEKKNPLPEQVSLKIREKVIDNLNKKISGLEYDVRSKDTKISYYEKKINKR